ncbi:hypothetical protein C0991_011083, partial [Blastosporella zonata]
MRTTTTPHTSSPLPSESLPRPSTSSWSAPSVHHSPCLTRILASWKPGMRTAVGRERIMDGQKVRLSLSTYPALSIGVC